MLLENLILWTLHRLDDPYGTPAPIINNSLDFSPRNEVSGLLKLKLSIPDAATISGNNMTTIKAADLFQLYRSANGEAFQLLTNTAVLPEYLSFDTVLYNDANGEGTLSVKLTRANTVTGKTNSNIYNYTIYNVPDTDYSDSDQKPGTAVWSYSGIRPSDDDKSMNRGYLIIKKKKTDDLISCEIFSASRTSVVKLAVLSETLGEKAVLIWDGNNDRGESVSPGLYFALTRVGDMETISRIMVLP